MASKKYYKTPKMEGSTRTKKKIKNGRIKVGTLVMESDGM
jgi:hypothetical protein